MELADAQNTARKLLDQHGLKNWDLDLDNARQRCGACHYSHQKITLSKHFIRLNNRREVRATILHEIAHAIAGPQSAHGRPWQKVARRIGAPISALNETATMPEPRWRLQCRSCERTVAMRDRRSLDLDRARCNFCGISLGKLQWIPN